MQKDDDKPVIEYEATGIDYVGVSSADAGDMIVLFNCAGKTNVAVRLPTEVVSLLEDRLEAARKSQAARRPPQ
ncbi:MAG: hypothetical protein M9945_12770 [Aquamicrobium sp.]|uniref:hypothetical protein n=1 Tax=Aquamicrobium sp. TaxID=1872579 RepID=UPI00349E5942|nr:hypothetical protein [Aquamicrobium sp.]